MEVINRTAILNADDIKKKIERISYQILEDNFDEQEILIAGILPRGNHIAKRIKDILDNIAPFTTKLLTIELQKQSSTLQAITNFDIQECHNKVVILVDDVLNSGKSLAYGMGVFYDIPVKKMRTLVLVDRNHKIFPVATDFTGLALSTVLKEHVDVVFSEDGEEDAVYLR